MVMQSQRTPGMHSSGEPERGKDANPQCAPLFLPEAKSQLPGSPELEQKAVRGSHISLYLFSDNYKKSPSSVRFICLRTGNLPDPHLDKQQEVEYSL